MGWVGLQDLGLVKGYYAGFRVLGVVWSRGVGGPVVRTGWKGLGICLNPSSLQC